MVHGLNFRPVEVIEMNKEIVIDEELIAEARKKAGNYYRSGYNCAEALFLTFREYVAPDLSEEMVKLVTPLGGGIGRSGCTCGALSGGVIILGALKGRTSSDQSRDEAYDFAGEFHNRFKKEFGSTCCRVLNKHEYHDPERGRTCLKIIGNSAAILMRLLQERGEIKAG